MAKRLAQQRLSTPVAYVRFNRATEEENKHQTSAAEGKDAALVSMPGTSSKAEHVDHVQGAFVRVLRNALPGAIATAPQSVSLLALLLQERLQLCLILSRSGGRARGAQRDA